MKKEINIMKVIGIILVVMGHTTFPYKNIIYLFHVSLFFFLSGYLFNDKYSLKETIIKKLKSLYIPFLIYEILFIFLNNFLHKINLVQDQYNFSKFSKAIFMSIIFKNNNELLGATWFVPTLFFSTIYFGIIYKWFRREKLVYIYFFINYIIIFLTEKLNFSGKKFVVIIVMSTFVFATGQLYKKYENKINLLKLFPIMFIFFVFSIKVIYIEYASLNFSNLIGFLIANYSGIYLIIIISRYLSKFNVLDNFLKCVSTNTFHIMALHFFIFRILNLIVVGYKNLDKNYIYNFPMISDKKLWLIYSLIGVIIPIIVVETLKNKFLKYIKIPSWRRK